ncbi:MAG: peroxidase-related enzyme [Planctomycetes bacterium]|nr:peroxidase-related enzyme [Planctomycetota bacterium]
MESHEADLRAEVQDDKVVSTIQEDYRQAKLAPATRTMLDYAVKLTKTPNDMCSDDIEALRRAGFRDEDVVDIVQIVSYFNYINRVLDGLGAEPEPGMRFVPKAGT